MTWVIFAGAVLALLFGPIQNSAGAGGSAVWQAWSVLQLILTTCLALTLLWGPGLLWLDRRGRGAADLALAILPGPIAMAALGVICWLMGQWQDPAIVARIGVGAVLAWIGRRLWRGVAVPRQPVIAAVLASGALVAGFAVAKASISTGPTGELYGGTISRTLEVGGHSDSRISFHIVQLVAHNFPPFRWRTASSSWRSFADDVRLWEKDAPPYFEPWSFASRGPLAGLAATPISLAAGAAVPREFPDQPWQPFDPQGFATYRIALIVIAALTAWAVFGLTAALLPAPWPLLAYTVAIFSPFFVHELYFTWPKLAAAGAVLAAFVLMLRGAPGAAGLVIGYGYLLHPLAILSVPVLGLWAIFGALVGAPAAEGTGLVPRVRRAALVCAGVLAVAVPWVWLGIFGTGETASQGGFVTYFRMADSRIDVTWADWLQDRWQSLLNTFVPFHLLTFDQTNRSINALNVQSDRWVRAGFLYWNTLPFALGLPAFAMVCAGVASACRRAFGMVLVVLILPTLFLIAYWGDSPVGLMRFCGHVLFASAIVVAVWGLASRLPSPGAGAGSRVPRPWSLFLHPVVFLWRGVEVIVMALGTTLLARRGHWRGPFQYSDALSLAIALGCVAWAVVIVRRAFASNGAPLLETSTS